MNISSVTPRCEPKSRSLLHFAVQGGFHFFFHFNLIENLENEAMVRYVMDDLKFKPSDVDVDGNTPLHFAPTEEIVELLTRHPNSDPSKSNNRGGLIFFFFCFRIFNFE